MQSNGSANVPLGDNVRRPSEVASYAFDIERANLVSSARALPLYLFGNSSSLVYVNNPKAACTFAQNILFFANHHYPYFDPIELHYSRYAFWRLGGTPARSSSGAIERLRTLTPHAFTFTRDPLRRLVSGFHSKIIARSDLQYSDMRDDLTCRGGIDLSPAADKRKSILAFCEWVGMYHSDPYALDAHFRPQAFNIFPNADPSAQIVPIATRIRVEDQDALTQFAQGFAPGLNLSRGLYNPSLGMDFSDYYSDDLAELTRRVFAIDYEMLGY